jgi:hypothetical protein
MWKAGQIIYRRSTGRQGIVTDPRHRLADSTLCDCSKNIATADALEHGLHVTVAWHDGPLELVVLRELRT